MSPPKSKICAGCRGTIKNKEFLECPFCKKRFDLICSSVTPKQFHDMSALTKQNWKCPECRTKQPKKDNTNTPVHERAISSLGHSSKTTSLSSSTGGYDSRDANVTKRPPRRNSINSDLITEPENLDSFVNNETAHELPSGGDISEIVRREVRAAIRSELPTLMRTLLDSNFNPIKAQLDAVQESVKFLSDQYEDFKDSIHTIVNENKALKAECAQLREKVSNLSDRVSLMEQHMRDSNLEIQGVPEFKSENVVNVVKQIAQVVSAKLTDEDVLRCTRVASINRNGQRPRAIVVKLRSTRCRDEVYSAVQRYNKAHQEEKLNSSHLGIAGEKRNIYVCEHLAPANKVLHAAARIKSRELGYKFVWVKNGNIFVRKDETARFIHIKNHQTVSSLE